MKEILKERRRVYAAANKAGTRERNRRNALRRWGWSPEEFARVLEEQGGKCRVCKVDLTLSTAPGGSKTDACADHDHKTGKRRGILCTVCNFIEGMLAKSELSAVDLLRRLEAYRKEFE